VTGWETTHLDELDAIPVAGVVWHPIRRRLGVRAFGINAYTAEKVGGHVIEEHDETGSGTGGHEEIYVVLRGRATFTVDGEELDAPAGTLVFVRDPNLKRGAISDEEDTVVLAVGGEPGAAYEVSPWEHYFAAAVFLEQGDWDAAIATIEEGVRQHPGNPSVLYNLACAEALGGRRQAAMAHLSEAITIDPRAAERAQRDPDFDAIRTEPGFPA
jgi:tetratricopeptide (TPR) repeat protein